jgi:hypothetical protein
MAAAAPAALARWRAAADAASAAVLRLTNARMQICLDAAAAATATTKTPDEALSHTRAMCELQREVDELAPRVAALLNAELAEAVAELGQVEAMARRAWLGAATNASASEAERASLALEAACAAELAAAHRQQLFLMATTLDDMREPLPLHADRYALYLSAWSLEPFLDAERVAFLLRVLRAPRDATSAAAPDEDGGGRGDDKDALADE